MPASNNRSFPLIAYAVFMASVFFIIASKVSVTAAFDDYFFAHALDNVSLVDYLKNRYEIWTGRVALEAILVTTIQHSLFWRLAIPTCVLLAGYSIWSMTLRNSLPYKAGIPIAVSMLLLIEQSVAADAMWWVTGFYNYLLPVSFGLYAIDVFIRQDKVAGWQKALSIPFVFIACSAEQPAICLIIAIALIAISLKGLTPFKSIFILSAIAATAVLFLSPGNHNRFMVESSRYMPEIFSYGLFQKVSIGMDRLHTHFRSYTNLPLLVSMVTAIAAVISNKGKMEKQDKLAVFILALSLAFFITLPLYSVGKANYLNGVFQFSPENWSLYYSYTSFAFTLLSICSMLWTSLKGNGYTAFLALSLATLVTAAIGMSPTVYESGQRVLFVFDVGLIIFSCAMISRVVQRRQS
ncbi:hypothetical protein P0E69_06955 [Chimaeribacter arupi]|uniref:hypothetical protein n=1 Tax=Chimaeribacter arupi TaxID=2060066 RepID=UPI002711F6FC|nr:hypothetical protein [Chimaeribacter arupi]WKZ93628.1 hypothetical protein P0E69_06955 [Chimaeribacter arupi]